MEVCILLVILTCLVLALLWKAVCATISVFSLPDRILQYGQMSIFVTKDSLHEIKGDSKASGEQGLLNLDPQKVVFYVGGYPASFKVNG